jgi:D-beta-D-heptose 7-phosphate kinase/D-beta-D-heptose 1-phosphate adenosyltransferase
MSVRHDVNFWDETNWTNKRVLVVGDVMLDRFHYGHVERISPEAPIPVFKNTSQRATAGGAGNVACNIVALGGVAALVATVGSDAAAAELKGLLDAAGISHDLLVSPRPTTVKVRFVARGQQLLRSDEEDSTPADHMAEDIVAMAAKWMPNCAAVVLSDYAKGTLTRSVVKRIITIARQAGKPVVVDPKHRDLSRYSGATVVTPNRSEVAVATGIDPANDELAGQAGLIACEQAQAGAVLVTRGADGMTLVQGGVANHFHSIPRQVFDVSGAGDTVVAAVSLTLARGGHLNTATRLANAAAGITVSKVGTSTVSRAELIDEMLLTERDDQVTSLERARRAVELWRSSGLCIGFTNGCFDLLHLGHIHLLRQAKAECDKLVVGINNDASVRLLKGPTRPVQDERTRATILANLRQVDLVIVFAAETPLELIEALRPDVLIKGADYRRDEVVGTELLDSYGGRVVLAQLLNGYSTTATLKVRSRAS